MTSENLMDMGEQKFEKDEAYWLQGMCGIIEANSSLSLLNT